MVHSFSQLELGVEDHHMNAIKKLLHPYGIMYLGCDVALLDENLLANNILVSPDNSNQYVLTPEILARDMESFLRYSFGLSGSRPPSYLSALFQQSIQRFSLGETQVPIRPISIRAPVATYLRKIGLSPIHISSMVWNKAPNISTLTEAVIATNSHNSDRAYFTLLTNQTFFATEHSV